MAVFDTTFLIYLLDPDANPPEDPTTGEPVTHLKERIEHLIAQIEQSNDKIVIPTPSLSEYLVGADEAGVEHFQYLQNKAVFRIAEFGTVAAVELAHLTRAALASGDKKGGAQAAWQKIKLDRQIVAIAKAEREQVIYSGDPTLHDFAKQSNLKPFAIHELELPPEDAQRKLDLDQSSDD